MSENNKKTIQVSLPVEMVDRIERNAKAHSQTIDEYFETCVEVRWDEYGYDS